MTGRSRQKDGTPALRALQKEGITYRLHSYDFDPKDQAIGEQAADALKVPASRVFKTLVVTIDQDRMAVALLPSDRDADLKMLGAALGGKRASMADLKRAERASGYVKGGISPFGMRQPLPAVIDISVQEHETVFVNGGKRGLQIEMAPGDLIASLRAQILPIARSD